ncbi:phosphatase PAP2 family protein [Myxococcus sp. K15C18031901]|uniref:phosphatase PAP2 family protein n=1 Tax=Myxococcus dinghuensis TaxID=2906761 RepID=UPI0020A74323|nr:phosphatase PAP2 family protein [Myxococcus dinghuensis]MCP3101030.1 phosphatase PAP2 family protein [Myxococcus dinghuensis]
MSRQNVAVTRLYGLLLLLGVCCLGFIALSDEVTEGETQDFDERVLRALRSPDDPSTPRGPRWLRVAAQDVTALGGAPVLVLMTVCVCGFLLLARRYRTLMLVLAATVGGTLLNGLLKRFFARPRPSVVPHLTEVMTTSFPSGHAMLSATVYLTLGALLAQLTERRRLKAYLLAVSLLLSCLVGLSRVYLGVHYPTDVLGGWVAGLAWALVTALVARALRRRSPALQEETRRPVE